MPVVQNTAKDPGGGPLYPANVTITLIAAPGGHAPGYVDASDIIGSYTTNTDRTGRWSATLTGNADITPSNTYYRVDEGSWTSYIVVPRNGGPYNLSELLVVPGAVGQLGITGVQIADNSSVVAARPGINFIPGTGMTITAVDDPSTASVDVTFNAAGGVSSVNGHTGVVNLVESDIPNLVNDLAARLHYRGAWASSTAYAVNDLVTYAGEELVCTTAHTSGSTFALTDWACLTARPGVFNVKLYGAQGDDVTDDTAAINAAVTAAVTAGIADGTNTAEVYFPPGTYVLSSPTTMGGATQGNAQVPLPVIADTGQKFVLKFSSVGDGTAFAHWQQTVGQRSGAVLRSTLTNQNADPTWGPQSVVGGPTVPVNGSGTYTNLKLVVENVTVMLPYNPSFLGYDLKLLAQATLISSSALADAGPAGSPALNVLPTNSNGLGIRMPSNGNNDCAVCTDVAVAGFYYGISIGEHFTSLRLVLLYCQVGVFIGGIGGTGYHGASIANLSVEACGIGVQAFGGTPGGSFPMWVGQMNTETTVTRDFDDANNNLTGQVMWSSPIEGNVPQVNGAANLKVINTNLSGKPGAATAPGVPATTTPLTNPFWRDAIVVVTGGNVSAVAVDGVAQGYTATGFTVIVPSGKSIALTYSVAPTWKWTLL